MKARHASLTCCPNCVPRCPANSPDLVAISNAMVHPGKVNIAMDKTIDYSVDLQADRSAETTLVLGFANTEPYPNGMPGRFEDRMRVYRADGTVFPKTTPDGAASYPNCWRMRVM